MKIPKFFPMRIKLKIKIFLFFLFLFALFLRLFGLNWDQGQHLHPDERMITMVVGEIKFPDFSNEASLSEKISILFSPDSPLNPKFFAYGSLPIYLLKFSGYILSHFDPSISSYDKINLLGRFISALFDSFTVLLIFLITKQLFSSNKKALLASFVYTFSVLPIQLSHFYAVDTLLTFFICLTLYRSIALYRYFTVKNSILAGISFGLALATKISATVLLISFFFSFTVETLLSLKKEILSQSSTSRQKIKRFTSSLINPSFWIKSRVFKLNKVILYSSIIILFTFLAFVICQPYSVIDFSTFWRQINEQKAMTRDAFVFPYTLQYVGTMSYWYQIKNIFLWGLAPSFGILSFLGLILTFKKLIKGLITPGNENSEGVQLILFSFFIAYFFVVGNFAIKFMRYCLPLYPIFAILSANALFFFKKNIRYIFFFVNLLWIISFLSIYSRPNTRVSATDWINNNIPPGSMILREHWDDGLPLGYSNHYNLEELTLYNSDSDPQKWPKINQQLLRADYLIIASNRLYTPLQKLINCRELPPDKCYTRTAQYYKDLFSGKLGYTQVAKFTSYPTLFGLAIIDDSADESFTVYDHPKVIIFKNNNSKR